MVDSIGNKSSVKFALQGLNNTANAIKNTTNNISSGKRVGSAKQNAATFNIAQKLAGNLAGLGAAKNSIDRASSITDIGITVGQDVSDKLLDLKELAVRASDSGLDFQSRQALNTEFVELRNSITDTVDNASFNGTNVIAGDDIVALTNQDGSQAVTIPGQDLSLGGTNVTLGATDSIATVGDAQATLSALETSLENVGQSLSTLGSAADSLSQQRTFADTLSDSIEVGIGNLVDANLAEESASLQANKVKEQLGLQTLAISNQAPKAVLSLFVQ